MISLERNLAKWQAAGLISGETTKSIQAYEAQNARPVAQWAIASLGLLALALGLVLVVAANWDRIGAPVKLGVHLAATVAAAFAAWDGNRRGRIWQTEGGLFLLVAFVLAGIALQGQVYQLTSPIWQLLALWAVLCSPILLLLGATRLTGTTLALMLGWLGIALAIYGLLETQSFHPIYVGVALALPFLLILMSLYAKGDESFAPVLRDIALAYLLGIGSLAHVAWASTVSIADVHQSLKVVPLPIIAAGMSLLFLHRKKANWRVLSTVIFATFAATAIVALTPHGDDWYWRLLGAAIFTAMWGAICWAAVTRGWRFLFGLSIAAIAIRLFIIYFELFGTLAATGVGMIIGGLLVLALLALWRRVMTLTRPRKEAGP